MEWACVCATGIDNRRATRPDFAIDESISFSFLPPFFHRIDEPREKIKERERERVEKEERFYRVQGLLSTGSETALPTVITRYTHPDIISTNSKLPTDRLPSLSHVHLLFHGEDFASRFLAITLPCLPYSPLIDVSWIHVSPSILGLRKTCASIGLWRGIDESSETLSKDDRWRFEEIYSFLKWNSGSNII